MREKLRHTLYQHYTLEGLYTLLHRYMRALEWAECKDLPKPNYDNIFFEIAFIKEEIEFRLDNPKWYMSTETQITHILREFDFDRVVRVMDVLDWRWVGRRPDIVDLKKEAERLLKDVSREGESGYPSVSISVGGFKATRHIYDGIPTLELIFKVTSWDMDNGDVTSLNYYWDEDAIC